MPRGDFLSHLVICFTDCFTKRSTTSTNGGTYRSIDGGTDAGTDGGTARGTNAGTTKGIVKGTTQGITKETANGITTDTIGGSKKILLRLSFAVENPINHFSIGNIDFFLVKFDIDVCHSVVSMTQRM